MSGNENMTALNNAVVAAGVMLEMGGDCDSANRAIFLSLERSGIDVTRPVKGRLVERDETGTVITEIVFDPEEFARGKYPISTSIRMSVRT